MVKLRKVGNSLTASVPNEVISPPFDSAFEKKMEKAEEIMARYRNTLHVLAK